MVQLSDRVEVEWFRAVPPISHLGEHEIAVSGIGTIAATRVTPRGRPADDGFIAVSMYARYIKLEGRQLQGLEVVCQQDVGSVRHAASSDSRHM